MNVDHDATMRAAAKAGATVTVTRNGQHVTTGQLVTWRPHTTHPGRNYGSKYTARVATNGHPRTYSLTTHDIEVTP